MTIKLVIIDPHKIWFKTPIDCIYNKVKPVGKYDWLIDSNFSSTEVFLFASYKLDSKLSLYEKLKEFIELKLWAYYSGILKKRFINKKEFEALNSSDIILIFSYGTFNYSNKNRKLMSDEKITELNNNSARIFVHLTHYAYGIRDLKIALSKLRDYEIVAEADIRDNNYFHANFQCLNNNKYRNLPFIPDKKFKKTKDWSLRKSIALATGTAAYIEEHSYTNYFKHNQLQSGRFEILNNKDSLSEYVDCKISIIDSDVRNRNDNRAIKKIQFALNLLLKKTTINNERSYYKRDVVDLLNDYKMVICPEENIGLPGIGFIEAMKCGCVLLTAFPKLYSIYGLLPGVHFIAFDGTIRGLIDVVKFYQSNDEELKIIEENAAIILNTFECNSVIEKFIA